MRISFIHMGNEEGRVQLARADRALDVFPVAPLTPCADTMRTTATICWVPGLKHLNPFKPHNSDRKYILLYPLKDEDTEVRRSNMYSDP